LYARLSSTKPQRILKFSKYVKMTSEIEMSFLELVEVFCIAITSTSRSASRHAFRIVSSPVVRTVVVHVASSRKPVHRQPLGDWAITICQPAYQDPSHSAQALRATDRLSEMMKRSALPTILGSGEVDEVGH